MGSLVILICSSPKIRDIEQLFRYLSAIYISFGKCPSPLPIP